MSDSLVDGNLVHLESLPALKQLELQFCPKLTDEGVQHIGRLQFLESLLLLDINITDRGLEELKTLKALTSLTVKGSKVTAEGIERLRAELPNCVIEYGQNK